MGSSSVRPSGLTASAASDNRPALSGKAFSEYFFNGLETKKTLNHYVKKWFLFYCFLCFFVNKAYRLYRVGC